MSRRGSGSGYVTYDSKGNRMVNQPIDASQADDDLDWYSKAENPYPDAYQVDRQNFQYSGSLGSAQNTGAINRARGDAAMGQQTYQMDPGMQQQARALQGQSASFYKQQMEGKTPSVAEMQMRQGLARSNAAASGMAASARGGGSNLAAAQRAAIRQQGMNSSNVAQSAAQLRAQEQAAGAQGLGGMANTIRAGDQGWEQSKAQQEAAQRALNQSAAQGWERLAQNPEMAQLQANQGYESAQMAADEANRKRAFDLEMRNTTDSRDTQKNFLGGLGSLIGGAFLSDMRMKKDISSANPYAGGGIEESNPYEDPTKKSQFDWKKDLKEVFGGGGSSASGVGAAGQEAVKKSDSPLGAGMGSMLMSDKDTKTDISKPDALEFADKLQPKSYRYKWEDESEPKRVGVMAQDMEKSSAGKSAVYETGMGKGIDVNRGLSLALASVAALKDEVDELRRGRNGSR